MDENRTEETTTIITNDKNNDQCHCEEHPIFKAIMCGLLIFLGAYCAFYTVSDWHYKRMLQSAMMPIPPQKLEHMMKKDMQNMDKMFKTENNFAWGQRGKSSIIHLEQDDDKYKIIIDLRAFDNNDKNLQVSTNGNILTISGRTIRKSKNNEQISEFQQNYMFGDNVKLVDLTKETTGNYYIITIPISDNDDIN